jgi:regulator of replication initiation timing
MSKKDEEKLKNIESMIESIFAENKRLKEELNELKTELDKALYSNNALITKNKKLKEALKFYAEEKNI